MSVLSLCPAGRAGVALEPGRRLRVGEAVEGAGALQTSGWARAALEEVAVVCVPGLDPIGMGKAPLGPSQSVFSSRLPQISLS